jgi:GTPase SAR1 family protein
MYLHHSSFFCLFNQFYSFHFFKTIYPFFLNNDQVPFVLVGNKIDLEDQREVSAEKGEALARKYGCHYIEASAKKNMNVEQVFLDVVNCVIEAKKEFAKTGKKDCVVQ